MRRWAPGWAVHLVAQALLVTASWIGVRLMVSYKALELDADPRILGLIAAAMAAPAFVGALPTGTLIDRFGAIRVMRLALLATILAVVGVIFSRSLVTLAVFAAIASICQQAVVIAQQTVVARRSPPGGRDQYFGTLSVGASAGQLLGAPLVSNSTGIAHISGLSETTAGLLASIACAALALLVSLAIPRSTQFRHSRGALHGPAIVLPRAPEVWRAVTVSAVVLATVDLLYVFVPLWALERDVSVQEVGWLLALRAAVSLVSRLGLTSLRRKLSRKSLLVASLLAGVVALIVMPWVGVLGAAVCMCGLGLALGLPQPLTMTWIVSANSESRPGSALALRMSGNRLAQTVIPVVAGAAAVPLGAVGAFLVTSLVLGAGAAVASQSTSRE